MKKLLLFIPILSCLQFCTQNKANSDTNSEKSKTDENEIMFSKLTGCFGFTDETGTRLLATECDFQDFDVAIGGGKIAAELKFSGLQNETENAENKQDFNNLSGNIFETTNGKLEKQTFYFISKKDWFKKSLIPLTNFYNSESSDYPTVSDETVKKIEKLKNRKIIKSEFLAKTNTDAEICLFVFERKGNDMLASLVYSDGNITISKDYPAVYDEISTWRADGGENPGLFKILFLAKTDEGLILGLTWAAPEGENAYIYKEKNGVFTETQFENYRYWAD
jgi:hypothetical protein